MFWFSMQLVLFDKLATFIIKIFTYKSYYTFFIEIYQRINEVTALPAAFTGKK